MKNYNLINQRATTCKHGGHCEWIACDKCSHYEPDVLNQQPCEDCISRQEAINCVTLNEFRYKIVEDIKTLPSITPKEKTGKWYKTGLIDKVACSNCKSQLWDITRDEVLKYKYCPNCGARMIEPQESEDKEVDL